MFNKVIVTLFLFSFSFTGFSKTDYSSLESLHKFFVEKNYRQAKPTKKLIEKLKVTKSSDQKLQMTRNFYKQLRSNKRFEPSVKQRVLKDVKTFYKKLKLTTQSKVTQVKKAVSRTEVKPVTVQRKPAVTNVEPVPVKSNNISRKSESSGETWFYMANIAALALMLLMMVSLWFKNRSLRRRLTKEALTVSDSRENPSTDYHELDSTLINSVVKLSSSILSNNYHIVYDTKGRITNFSKNLQEVVVGNIQVGMTFKDFIDRNFHEIGENENKYFLNLHTVDKFYSMSSKGIKKLGINICQFIEVENAIVKESQAFQDSFYLEKPVSLIDLFENSLVEASSFREFNLLEHVHIDLVGADTSFQRENDLRNLFTGIGQTIKDIFEEDAPDFKVKFETFQRRHIVNVECLNYRFQSFQDPDVKYLVDRVEEIKRSLEYLGGSIVVKNITDEVNSRAVIQVIFEQVTDRNLTVEEDFELFEL